MTVNLKQMSVKIYTKFKLLKHSDLAADTRVCDGNDGEGSPPDRLGYSPMGRFREMLENAWQMACTDVQSATIISTSHTSSGNGAISDTLSKDKAKIYAELHDIVIRRFASVFFNSLSTKTPATEKKIPSFGLPLPASTSANIAAKDNSVIVTTPRMHRKRHSGAIPIEPASI